MPSKRVWWCAGVDDVGTGTGAGILRRPTKITPDKADTFYRTHQHVDTIGKDKTHAAKESGKTESSDHKHPGKKKHPFGVGVDVIGGHGLEKGGVSGVGGKYPG